MVEQLIDPLTDLLVQQQINPEQRSVNYRQSQVKHKLCMRQGSRHLLEVNPTRIYIVFRIWMTSFTKLPFFLTSLFFHINDITMLTD